MTLIRDPILLTKHVLGSTWDRPVVVLVVLGGEKIL